MKKLTASAAVLALVATASTATAGGLIEPVQEPMVAMPTEQAGSGLSPVALAAGAVGVLAVGAIIANNDDDDDDGDDSH